MKARQYFYKNETCPAHRSDEPQCTCWYDEGTGPQPEKRYHNVAELRQGSWRQTPGTGPSTVADLSVIANRLHYPECWDVAAYPTVLDALTEVFETFRCQEHAKQLQETVGPLPYARAALCVKALEGVGDGYLQAMIADGGGEQFLKEREELRLRDRERDKDNVEVNQRAAQYEEDARLLQSALLAAVAIIAKADPRGFRKWLAEQERKQS